jgi:acetyltransferase-like isoleucine patch superfamily enzyme
LNVSRILDSLTEKAFSSFGSGFYAIYLRKKGFTVGEGSAFFGRVHIDPTRPCLVEIGKNCVLTEGVIILTHGYDWAVFREKYGELLASSGKVVIEDNVFVGMRSIILKGVRIGRNTIIGAGSVVTRDIPPNSVAVGNPCKVIMKIDRYYEKRKREYVDEAKAYAIQLYKKRGKAPKVEDFWEEFPLFLDRHGDWHALPVRKQLGPALEKFIASKPLYSSFRDFLIDAGVPATSIDQA